MDTFFVFAHQDDETFVSSRIIHEREMGNNVACVFLSNGAAKGVSSETRCKESATALASLGIAEHNISFLGATAGVPDGRVVENLEHLYTEVCRWVASARTSDLPPKIYFPAWEGGHPDHDACHLLGLALASSCTALEMSRCFSLYNGYRMPWKLFRVMTPLPQATVRFRRLPLRVSACCAMLPLRYPSQRRTWMGLFPGLFVKYVLGRYERLILPDLGVIAKPPHQGCLLYEKMFSISYPRFASAAKPFVQSLLEGTRQ